MKASITVFIAVLILGGIASAADLTVKMNLVTAEGVGKEIGTITLSETPHGVLLTPQLSGLPTGLHGFHLHENPKCEPAQDKDGKMTAAQSAGAHFDPKKASKHAGPYAQPSHLGDLPPLYVEEDGKATLPVLAPKLKNKDLQGHSLMIHEGGDNYSDQPKPLGGGGARIACGVVQ